MEKQKCYRCGKTIKNRLRMKTLTIQYPEKCEQVCLCDVCVDLVSQFITPAYIPGYSYTRYDILKKKQESLEKKSPLETVRNIVKGLYNNDCSVAQIAKKTGMTQESVVFILMDIREVDDV